MERARLRWTILFSSFALKERKNLVRAGRESGLKASFVFLRWEIECVCLLMAVISREGK